MTLRIVRFLVVASVVAALLAISDARNPVRNVLGVYLPLIVGLLGLGAVARRGHAKPVGWALSAMLWVVVTAAVFLFGGLLTSCAAAYGIVVMIAGATIGRTGSIVFTVASFLGAAAAWQAETHGWLPTPLGPLLPFNALVAVTVTVMLTAIFHDWATRDVQIALQETATALTRLRTAESENETRALHGAALGRLGERALSTESASGFSDEAVKALEALLPAERAIVWLSEPGVATGAGGSDGSSPLGLPFVRAEVGIDRAIDGETVALSTVQCAVITRHLGIGTVRAALATPIPGRAGTRGVLLVIREDGPPFDSQQHMFLTAVAGMIGNALDHETAQERALSAQKLEAVGRLAGGVAHDFNNLLTVMVSATSELRRLVQGDNDGTLDDLDSAIQTASLLSKQLLTLSRRDPTEQSGAVSLSALVFDLGPMLRRLIGAEVTLDTEVAEGDTGLVLGTRAGFEQVLLNLVINARQATPSGGTITVHVRSVGSRVELAVSDTGSGIDDALKERIFQPFFTTKPDGTGLGLASVVDVAKRYRGSVALESSVGGGSTFTVRLPALVESGEPFVEPVAPVAAGKAKTADTFRARVLVVDDHELVLRAATRALESLGFQVVAKRSGADALSLLDGDRAFALLITDVNMPEIDGFVLAREVAERGIAVPVLFISGFVDASTRIRNSGHHFLAKPFTPEALAKAVKGCLDGRVA